MSDDAERLGGSSSERWGLKRWDTPLSGYRSLVFITLADDTEQLQLTVEGEDGGHYRVQAGVYPYVRSVPEAYRCKLWARFSPEYLETLGPTRLVDPSPLLAQFRRDEPLAELHNGPLKHYMICTTEQVIDILSPEPPEIVLV